MGIVRNLCSLKFEVKVVEARNVELKSSPSSLFVRFYLHAGSNRKVELNSTEICSRPDNEVMIWNQSFGLECQGDETAVEELKQESVRRGSLEIGYGVGWDGMEIERFVVMCEKKDEEDCNKPLMLKIGLKLQASKLVNTKRVEDLCGCKDCKTCDCLDYEAFAVACALDGI
uniref:80A08_18 n=1 Tax=Brassica rapa subsp. pekinensis TaxID=51351 RepID=Q4ABP9_BRARP|nr:80A08_18 [Brassica rapa subsp. pekinensis]